MKDSILRKPQIRRSVSWINLRPWIILFQKNPYNKLAFMYILYKFIIYSISWCMETFNFFKYKYRLHLIQIISIYWGIKRKLSKAHFTKYKYLELEIVKLHNFRYLLVTISDWKIFNKIFWKIIIFSYHNL